MVSPPKLHKHHGRILVEKPGLNRPFHPVTAGNIGLSGGIVKVSDDSPAMAQLPDSGMTLYYTVDSLDEVGVFPHHRLPLSSCNVTEGVS
jgi:hypothetical protein